MPKRTYQPTKRTRKQQFGFRARMATKKRSRHSFAPPPAWSQAPTAEGRRGALCPPHAGLSTLLPDFDDAAPAPREPRLRFPKSARLISTSEFTRVREKGRPVHGKAMLLGIYQVPVADADAAVQIDPVTRTGIITSRRIGSAVERNRVRRRLREIVRSARPGLREGLWLVVVAKPPAAKITFAKLRDEWMQLAKRGGPLS